MVRHFLLVVFLVLADADDLGRAGLAGRFVFGLQEGGARRALAGDIGHRALHQLQVLG